MQKSNPENRLKAVGRFEGRFASIGREKLGKTTGVRLPLSLEQELEQFLQKSPYTKSEVLTQWIREGLERDNQ